MYCTSIVLTPQLGRTHALASINVEFVVPGPPATGR
jgi:hypothetical protein